MAAISIFFDTNIIESQLGAEKEGLKYHKKIIPNKLFNDVVNYIKGINATDKTELYISSISWEEVSIHLRENFKNTKDKLTKTIGLYRDAYGTMLDLSYEFTLNTIEEYNNHLETIKNEFLDSYNCIIIEYPRTLECFEGLVNKCIHKQPPFQKANKGSKEFSDAGFKDALILETILQHKKDTGNVCVLISSDKDFSGVTEITICSDFESFKENIDTILGIQNVDAVRTRLNDEYIKETIVAATGNAYDESVSSFDIVDIVPIAEEDDLFDITIKTTINETEYNIKCQYEMSSNNVEVLDYHIENE